MNLTLFNTKNLFDAATDLFQQLGIKLNSNTAEPLLAKDLLKVHFKENETFQTIENTYFIGIIDDSIFKSSDVSHNYSLESAKTQAENSYEGLLLFALELTKQPT